MLRKINSVIDCAVSVFESRGFRLCWTVTEKIVSTAFSQFVFSRSRVLKREGMIIRREIMFKFEREVSVRIRNRLEREKFRRI